MTHRYYTSHDQSNSYSMLFSMPDYNPFDETAADMYSYTSSSSSSSVDCTLSLGTPSTRLTYDTENRNHHDRRSGSSCMSSNYWDMVPSPPPSTHHHHKPSRGTNSSNSGGDPLLARRCANCDTTSTPLWRNGPRGPKSLCNACGIRFKKEERRASAAAASAAAGAGAAPGVMEHHQHMLNNSWVQYSQPQKMQCYSPDMGNEYSFIDGDVSWRLNVADRPSLVHDFSI